MRLIRLLKKDLATEISTWVDRDLISIDQARAICGVYGVNYDEIRSRSTAYRVLVVLGFLFMGLALVTVIGANWDAIPRGVRMAGLLALTAGTHAVALRRQLSDRASLATGLFILGNLFTAPRSSSSPRSITWASTCRTACSGGRSAACRSRYCCAAPGSPS